MRISSNEYPKNVVNDEPIDDKKYNFVDFLAKMTGTLGDYVCNAVTCDVDISSKSDCNTGKFNPYLYFGIFSLKNFFEFTSKAHEALHDQFGAFTAKANKMALEFTDHKMATSGNDAAAANTALTLLTGVLAFFAPVMAAGEAAAAATVAGASVGLAVSFNGILGSAQDAAAQM